MLKWFICNPWFFPSYQAELKTAKVQNYDIRTAVDVLSTGTYQRLPLLKQILPPALYKRKVNAFQIKSSLQKVESSLQHDDTLQKSKDERKSSLGLKVSLWKECMPSVFRRNLVIKDGIIYLESPHEFKVKLSSTRQVLDVEILAGSCHEFEGMLYLIHPLII